ncbi:hypothetical protein [Caproicibacterium amylolyticum]|uniref:Prenyltransferase and squalene oxidase repeat-containing protein n=1 Tax=Caproicibacterium amylolyticum TaxID=2766537 RepID=A0A7G9WG46_9FIRM|nr:hypothetical protein [Caproicibacterium amylolyticum]QNO17658.1 hypothetical protein H6X83_12115 [Caproicibacterium amylolyticum]
MKLSKSDFDLTKNWIYRNARHLDFVRWQYHFENGCKTDVLDALLAYQNPDGGFGHALEADSWNPNSTPIQTATAVQILKEINFADQKSPLIQGIVRYLGSKSDFEGNRWKNTVESNNHYPHAPWWHTNSDQPTRSQYNPTAILGGFLLQFSEKDSTIYKDALEIIHHLTDSFLKDPQIEMHPLLCVSDMLSYIHEANLQNQFSYTDLCLALHKQVQALIKQDANNWSEYAFRPSRYIQSPDNVLYEENKEILNKELDYVLKSRNAEGVWDITWSWENYEKEFAVSENWWKADVAIKNMLLLQAFGRIED